MSTVASTTWDGALNGYSQFMQAAAVSPATIRLRRYWLERFAEHHADPWAVSHHDLVDWLADGGWKPNTIKSARAAVTGFYRWATDEGLVSPNPAARLPRVHVPRGVPRPADELVFRAALDAASPRDRLMLELAGMAGLRRREIATLRTTDVVDGGLRITGKGGTTRFIPIGADLRARLLAREPGYVFPGRYPGTHMNVDAVGKAMRRALGFQASAHMLRHRFGTRAYAGTHDIRAVQEVMGHASIASTEGYTRVAGDALAAAVAAAA